MGQKFCPAMNARDVDDLIWATDVTMLKEARNQELCSADRVGGIDIDQTISTASTQTPTLNSVRRIHMY